MTIRREPQDDMIDGLFAIARALEEVGIHLKYLGNGDAATTMGAIEAFGIHIGEKLDDLTSAINAASCVVASDSLSARWNDLEASMKYVSFMGAVWKLENSNYEALKKEIKENNGSFEDMSKYGSMIIIESVKYEETASDDE